MSALHYTSCKGPFTQMFAYTNSFKYHQNEFYADLEQHEGEDRILIFV